MPLCYRFNSILSQFLLPWLEGYPWTKMEIALMCLTLLLRYNHSAEPPWWRHISLGSSCNNPAISWLWRSHYNATSDRPFFHLLLAFLQCPKHCRHLSIGKFSSTGHFAHLCAQIVLNSCLCLPDSLNLMYVAFFFFFLNIR